MILGAFVSEGQMLTGRVLDNTNGLPLAGVNIYWEIAGEVTVSNSAGAFQIKLLDDDTLVFSYVGYATHRLGAQEIPSSNVVRLQANERMLTDVVISGYNDEVRLSETSGSVGLIRKIDLQRDNETLIVPALNRIPGVYMQSGAYNTNRLTIRGIGSRSPFSTTKIRAYFRNIPLTTGDGETTIEDLDLEILDRVEVLRGPSSSVYGAGLGGTTLVQPAVGDDRVETELIAGSYGLIKSNTRFAMTASNARIAAAYNYMHSDGYRDNNNYDRHTVSINGSVDFGDKTSVALLLAGIDLMAFIPSSIDSATFTNNPRAAAPTWENTGGFEDTQKFLGGIDLRHFFDSDIRLDVSLFSNHRTSYELRPFNILDDESTAWGSRGTLSIPRGKTKTQLGYEYFNENYLWTTFVNNNNLPGGILSDNQETRTYVNAFAQFQLFLTNFTITAGVNANNTGYVLDDRYQLDTINQSGDYTFETIWSPRVALNYFLKKGMLFTSVSHGFSPPSFSETLAPDGLINPDIRPEQGINYEVGYKYTGNRLSGDISAYSMHIEDLIVSRRTQDDQVIGLNAGKTLHNGLELSIRYAVGQHQQWVPFASATFTDYTFSEFVDGGNDYSGNPLTGVPRHVINAGVDFQHPRGLFGNISYMDVGTMPMRDDNSISNDRFGVATLKLGYTRTMRKWEIMLSAGVNNLLDSKYASMIQINAPSFGGRAPRYYYPGLPKNFFSQVRASYLF